MEIEWFGVFKENLQKAVDVGGGQKILASGDEGNLLFGVVHHHCEVVGSGDVLAGEDDVTEFQRQDVSDADLQAMGYSDVKGRAT